MSVWYPSMAVNLTLRFDEALLPGMAASPKSGDDLAKSANLIPDFGLNKGLTAFVADLAGPPQPKPALLAGKKDRLSHLVALVPRMASTELSSYRQAGKFSLSFSWRDLPIDPRAIRAIGVELYVGTVTANDFARGHKGEKDNGRLASQVLLTPENLVLVGVVDNHSVAHTNKGSEVKLDGRDLRGIFIDGKFPAAGFEKLDVKKPLNQLVSQIIGLSPAGSRVNVRYLQSDWPAGAMPAPNAPGIVGRQAMDAKNAKPRATSKGNATQLSYWDVITQFSMLVGAVPYFKGHDLWLRPARSLFAQAQQDTQNGSTPFANGARRTVPTANSSLDMGFRRMVYGRNIEDLNFERKLNGTKVPVVEVVSYNPDSRDRSAQVLVATWPAKGVDTDSEKVDEAQVTGVDPSGEQAQTEKLRISVPGIKDKDRLTEIARQIYEEVGRGEMGGSCSSKDLASLGGVNEDADLLRLRPGDAVEFLVDATNLAGQPPVIAQLTKDAGTTAAEAVKDLVERLNLDKDLANVLVQTSKGSFQALQNVFRVSTVKYSWEANKGIAVDFDFQNYVEARSDVERSTIRSAAQSAQENVDQAANRLGNAPFASVGII